MDESIDSYVACLRSLAKTCNYGELQDSLIRDRLVMGIRNNSVRKRLLQDSKLTLKSCINMCRAGESTEKKLKEIQHDEVLNYTQSRDTKRKDQSKGEKDTGGRQDRRLRCKFCNKVHTMKKEECPAWDKTCISCGGMNHFAVVCRQSRQSKEQVRTVHKSEKSESDEDNYLLTVTTVCK